MYIDAELARPAPRKVKYVPKENPVQVDPFWLCLLSILALGLPALFDILNKSERERPLMLAVLPLLLLPFLFKAYLLHREKRLVRVGTPVPAVLHMIPRKLWWPENLFGFSGVIYDIQAKYEWNGKTYVVDRLGLDPAPWRGRYVTVMIDPRRPRTAVIYQLCCYHVV